MGTMVRRDGLGDRLAQRDGGHENDASDAIHIPGGDGVSSLGSVWKAGNQGEQPNRVAVIQRAPEGGETHVTIKSYLGGCLNYFRGFLPGGGLRKRLLS